MTELYSEESQDEPEVPMEAADFATLLPALLGLSLSLAELSASSFRGSSTCKIRWKGGPRVRRREGTPGPNLLKKALLPSFLDLRSALQKQMEPS